MNCALKLAVATRKCRAASGGYTVVFMPKRNELSACDRKESSHSSFVPNHSCWWRLILKYPRAMMILWSLTGALCCAAPTSESKIHLTHAQSQAGQDHCVLQPHCSWKKQSTVKFIYCNGFGHNWTAAGELNWTGCENAAQIVRRHWQSCFYSLVKLNFVCNWPIMLTQLYWQVFLVFLNSQGNRVIKSAVTHVLQEILDLWFFLKSVA